MHKPLVHIVSPIHNVAAFLEECIESVLAQTYDNWIYTIVDNCSTDASLEIARRYASAHPRIEIVSAPEFFPPIQNHNFTLGRVSADAKYCKVVFGDDWIFPECLERMVAAAESSPSAGLVGAYCLEGNHVVCAGLPYTTTLISGREICRRHLLDKLFVFGSANSLLYRADLVRDRRPFFNEANIHADTEVCFDLLKSTDFAFVHQVLTFTRVRTGSVTSKCSDINSDFGGMLRILRHHGPNYLIKEEVKGQLCACLSAYYRFLSKSLFTGRDKTFWDYHKTQFHESGIAFSRLGMARGLVANMLRVPAKLTEVLSSDKG
jgi:glycosyltransferase involved in cell wall biosynthesis